VERRVSTRSRRRLVAVVAATLLVLAVASVAGPRTYRRIVAPAWPNDIAAGDFDGDGKCDLAVAVWMGNEIRVLRGDATGLDEPGDVYPFGHGIEPFGIVTCDVNGDGNLDLACRTLAGEALIVMRGLGDGRFTTDPVIDFGHRPHGITVGDWNQDGRDDLAVVFTFSPRHLEILVSTVPTGFTRTTIPLSGELDWDIESADLNDDGHRDLVLASEDPAGMRVLFGNGTGAFPSSAIVAFPIAPEDLALADFDEDGHVDVLAAESRGDVRFALRLGDGSGSFILAKELKDASLDLENWFVEVGDFNQDGHVDFFGASMDRSELVFVPCYGPGLFPGRNGARQLLRIGDLPRALDLGDFDGDERLDLAFGLFATDGFGIALGDPDGGFVTAKPFRDSAQSTCESIDAADFDGDGNLDVAMTGKNGGVVFVDRGDGAGSFTPAPDVPVAGGPIGLATADFDGDGRIDLAVCGERSSNVTLVAGLGDGTFSTSHRFSAGLADHRPTFLRAADFDSDGRTDVVAAFARLDSGDRRSALAVFENVGGGLFAVGPELVVPGRIGGLAVEDLDDDGYLDAIAVHDDTGTAGTERVVVGFGDGAGGFDGAPFTFATGGRDPRGVAVADLDADGHRDVALALYDGCSVLYGTGTPSRFFTPVFRPLATELGAAIAAGDFDVDGRLDLAVAGEANLITLHGAGGRSFSVSDRLGTTARSATSMVLRDFDRDGRPDLAVASTGGRHGSFVGSRRVDLDDAMRGNVNAAAGPVANVLTVNGGTGGSARRVMIAPDEPLTVFMAAPPSRPTARFALHAALGAATPGTAIEAPLGYGRFAFRPPILGGRVARTWNNTGDPTFGAADRPSAPAPSAVFAPAGGAGRRLVFTLQGFIVDPASPSGSFAVTNGIVVDVR